MESIYWASEVDWTQFNVVRAGVIPYVVVGSQIMFCLGVDRETSDLTDFGGGFKDSDGSPLGAALREFKEESKGVFGPENYQLTALDNSLCLIQTMGYRQGVVRHMLIVLLEVEGRFLNLSEDTFRELVLTSKDEVSAIQWCTENAFADLVYSARVTRLYSRVKNFITRCITFPRLIYWLRSVRGNRPRLSFQKTGQRTPAPPALFIRRQSCLKRPRLTLTCATPMVRAIAV